MAAIVFGFMWLNQPSEEELARRRAEAEQIASQGEKVSADNDILRIDTVSTAELNTIRATIRQYGHTDSAANMITLQAPGAELTLSGETDRLGGFVSTPAGQVAVADIVTSNYEGIDRSTANCKNTEQPEILPKLRYS